MFIFSALLICIESLNVIYVDFKKVSLILFFAYMGIVHFCYLLLSDELARSCYNALFSRNQIFEPSLVEFKVEVRMRDGVQFEGTLSNWDEDSAFIYTKQMPKIRNNKGLIKVHAFEQTFEHKFRVSSKNVDDSGIGIELSQASDAQFEWNHFTEVCLDMGLHPQVTR